MSFLSRERQSLERFMPGLDAALAATPLAGLERPGGPGLRLFCEHGGPALLVPRKLGGRGASAVDAVRAQRALGARAPSVAVATSMHHLTAVAIAAYGLYAEAGAEILRGVAREGHLLASGFAEGRSGADVLDARVRAVAVEGGYRVSGSKKPCSLSHSMHAVMAGVSLPDRPGQRGLALLFAGDANLRRRPFWASPILAAAESDELIFEDVFVPKHLLLVPTTTDSLDPIEGIETGGMAWFELLISAAYVGVASALAERVFARGKGSPTDRVALGAELEAATMALEGVAQRVETEAPSAPQLFDTLLARYAVQESVARAASLAVELGGGIDFVTSNDVSYLFAASRALGLHPPARSSMGEMLAGYLAGTLGA